MPGVTADSNQTLADLYQSYFSFEGYEVDLVEDGLQCLSYTRQHAPDVLILEYELLWGGGDGVLATLREESPRRPIGVVLTSCDYSVEISFTKWHRP